MRFKDYKVKTASITQSARTTTVKLFVQSLYIMRTITQELHVTVYGLKSRSRSEIDMLFIMTETNTSVTKNVDPG